MAIDTTTIIGGPALVFFQGATFYSQSDIVLNLSKKTFPIQTDRFRKVTERVSDEELTITFTPAGEWEDLDVLWPYTETLLGSLITTGDDLVIHTFAGKKLTFYNAAVTKMPTITASAIKTLIGAVTFEAFLKNNTDPEDTAARFVIVDEALVDTTFVPDNVLTQPYTAAWGASPWDNFETKAGWVIDPNESFETVTTDSLGQVSKRLMNLEVTAKAQPLGLSESQLMTKLLLQGTGAVRGRDLAGDNLNLVGDGVYIRLYGAALKMSAQHFAADKERLGELTWAATRTFTAGSPNPLFFVGTAAP